MLILSQISATPRQIGPQTRNKFEKTRRIGPQTKKEFENDMTTEIPRLRNNQTGVVIHFLKKWECEKTGKIDK